MGTRPGHILPIRPCARAAEALVAAIDRIAGPWRRLRRKARDVGPPYALQLAFESVVPPGLLRINKLLIRVSDPRNVRPDRRWDPGLGWAAAADLDERGAGWPAPLRARLGRGETANIFERDGAVIGYRTFHREHHDQADWLRYILGPGDIWVSDIWTEPSHRGRGIHGLLRRFAAGRMVSEGTTRIVSNIDAFNRNSIRSNAKYGGRTIASIFYVRILGLTVARVGQAWRIGWWGPARRLVISIEDVADDAGR